MIVRGNQQQQIIRDMPSNDIFLDVVSLNGKEFFEYTVSFLVNQSTAYQNTARTASITVSYKSVNRIFNLFSNKSLNRPAEVNNKIKNLTSLRLQFNDKVAQEQSNSTITAASLDIFSNTKKISVFRRKQAGLIDLSVPSLGNVIPLSRIKHTFRILQNEIPPNGNIVIRAVIKNQDDMQIQDATFTINHFDALTRYNIPSKLPSAYASPNFGQRLRVNTFTSDKRVSGVAIYSRKVSNSLADSQQEKFKSLYTTDVTVKTPYTTTQVLQNSLASYEIRALATLKSGIQLGNIINAGKSIKKSQSISGLIYCLANQGKVEVYIKNLDPRYKYVQILRKDSSRLQDQWEKIGSVSIFSEGDFVFVDENVRSEKVYFYTAQCQDRMGNIRLISTTYAIRTTYYTPGIQFNISSAAVQLPDNRERRTFDIALTLEKKEDVTNLLESFKAQGIDIYYDEELKTLAGNLDAVFKISVKRVDIERNEVVDLGVKNIGKYEDVGILNADYIFEVLYRNQADLFEEIGSNIDKQEVFDPRNALNRGSIISNKITSKQKVTKKNFTQKFLSKSSLIKGTLSYSGTKNTGSDTSGFLDGRIGVSKLVSFLPNNEILLIKNFKYTLSNNRQKLMSFDVDQSTVASNIDFFEIYYQDATGLIFLGNCHYKSDATRQYYLDQVTDRRLNGLTYVIKPIKLDGTSLSVITSPFLRAS